MRFFLDTACTKEIQEATNIGVVEGVTTNPSLIAKEGRDMETVIREISSINRGAVNAEVISLKADEMIDEGKKLAAIAKNVVVKIPMTIEGLKAVSVLNKEGIKTNVTLVFSANQALLASRAGATYVSPFIGRLDDIDFDGIELIHDIAGIFKIHDIDTKIIAASIRHPLHVSQAAAAGADIATVPYKVLLDIFKHPLTQIGIEKFMADWENANKK